MVSFCRERKCAEGSIYLPISWSIPYLEKWVTNFLAKSKSKNNNFTEIFIEEKNLRKRRFTYKYITFRHLGAVHFEKKKKEFKSKLILKCSVSHKMSHLFFLGVLEYFKLICISNFFFFFFFF